MKTFGFFLGAGLAGLFTFSFSFRAAESGANTAVGSIGFTNLDFEAGALGETPPGWFVPRVLADQGFSALLTTNQPDHGAQCVEIRWPEDRTPSANMFANLMQRMDATALRGKQIKVTAAIRVQPEKPNGRAQMWLRVDRPSGMGAFDNMGNRPVISRSWADYTITADVADDARTLNLGLMTLDGATAWWDNVRIEVLGGFQTLTEPPRPLSDSGLSNLVAFTRLLGYVRHFHPSDQVATNDWLAFTVAALPQIESAGSPAELAERLEAVFHPVAPTVRVFESGKEPALPAELTPTGDLASLKIRVWEHFGYWEKGSAVGVGVYHCQRLELDARDLATLPAYAQPTNVYRSNLSAGVACLVPTALYADDRGTLPHPETTPTASSAQIRYTPEHRGARLATVMMAWNILQHFYPYFDVVDTDWSKELKIALRKAATDADEAAFFWTLNRLIVALQDGHGTLTGPGMPRLASLPVKVELIENQIVVVAVAPEVTHVHRGDIVEELDGISAMKVFEQLESEVSAATPQRRKQVAFRFGWGPRALPAKLVLRGADGVERTEVVARTDERPAFDSKRPPKLQELKPGVFYVDITRLKDDEFNEAVPRLAQAKGLVFDLRGYPSGSPQWLTHLSPKVMQCARWNIPKAHRPDHSDVEWVEERWDLQPSPVQFTANRVFLTDGSAISYAETVMGIVEAYHLGEIVGEPTSGTNGNITQADLPLGYRMLWTGMRVLKHDGSRHHGIGILPTVPVAKTIKGIRSGHDEQLDRALALVE